MCGYHKISFHSKRSKPFRGQKKTYPFMRTPSLFYLGYTEPHSILSRPNQRPINVEYFQAQQPSRANQPRVFTSDSIQAPGHSLALGLGLGLSGFRVGWNLFTKIIQTGCTHEIPPYGRTECRRHPTLYQTCSHPTWKSNTL